MALSNPKGQFGAHSVCFYNRTTGVPIAYVRVLGECNIDFSAEFENLEGGSQQYPFDTEIKSISSNISLSGKEYEPGTMQLLLGGSLTENAAESTGAIDALANKNGTSIINASNGIEDVTVTSGDHGDLKEGKYIIKATGAQVAELYCLSDVDFKHGTDVVYEDDTLKIADIDVSAGDHVEADLGLTFEAIGTPAFTTGDTAEFYVRKPNTSSIELSFGQTGSEFSEVGCLIAGQKSADGTITYIELYKCKGAGMPISFTAKGWSEWSITIQALYDSAKDAVGCFRRTIAA